MFNRTVSKNINSATLMAASQDSLNDVMATSATLISLILSLYTDLPVDGIMGAVVSIIVLKAGIDISLKILLILYWGWHLIRN